MQGNNQIKHIFYISFTSVAYVLNLIIVKHPIFEIMEKITNVTDMLNVLDDSFGWYVLMKIWQSLWAQLKVRFEKTRFSVLIEMHFISIGKKMFGNGKMEKRKNLIFAHIVHYESEIRTELKKRWKISTFYENHWNISALHMKCITS